jgi:hypothetical protein
MNDCLAMFAFHGLPAGAFESSRECSTRLLQFAVKYRCACNLQMGSQRIYGFSGIQNAVGSTVWNLPGNAHVDHMWGLGAPEMFGKRAENNLGERLWT